MSRGPVAGLAAVALLVAALGFLAGRALRPDSGAAYEFDVEAPALQAVGSAATSKAGFTGFPEGNDVRTVISGRVVSASEGAITLERADGTTTTLRVTPQSPLRRLEPAGRAAIRAGAQVLVRREGDNAAAVLVVASP